MIDGVKIRVNIDSALWLTHVGLKEFRMSVGCLTGEVYHDDPLKTDIKGLTFKVIPSVVNPSKPLCYVLGSLTKYKNGGRDNVENMTHSQLCEVVEDLKKYHIDPSVSRLENIEFGLNIDLPFSCDAVLNSIVSMPTKPMTELRVDKTTIGKRCDFAQYEIKIYDKGKAENSKASNVLRVELRIKKMQFLQKTNIRTLHDLTDTHQLAHAGAMLLKSLNDVIMFNYDFEKLDHETPLVRENILHWTNPKTWKAWKGYQRRRHHQAMEAFQNEGEAGNIKAVLMQAIYKNWCDLVGGENGFSNDFTTILKKQNPKIAYNLGLIGNGFDSDGNNFTVLDAKIAHGLEENCNNFTKLENENAHGLEVKKMQKLPTVSQQIAHGLGSDCNNFTIKINGKKVTKEKQQQKKIKNKIEKIEKSNYYFSERICNNCKADISHKRPQSVFCSDRCRFTARDKMRERTNKPKNPTPTPSKTKAPIVQPFDIGEALAELVGMKKA